jgi:hypothetical protein
MRLVPDLLCTQHTGPRGSSSLPNASQIEIIGLILRRGIAEIHAGPTVTNGTYGTYGVGLLQ